jgi:hypothetical protein
MNPKTEMDNQIEKTGRAPIVVGRVTPCAPRLQPTYANFPRRRFPEDECANRQSLRRFDTTPKQAPSYFK